MIIINNISPQLHSSLDSFYAQSAYKPKAHIKLWYSSDRRVVATGNVKTTLGSQYELGFFLSQLLFTSFEFVVGRGADIWELCYGHRWADNAFDAVVEALHSGTKSW